MNILQVRIERMTQSRLTMKGEELQKMLTSLGRNVIEQHGNTVQIMFEDEDDQYTIKWKPLRSGFAVTTTKNKYT